MKRTNNPGEWTDGKHLYTGSAKTGFKRKDESNVVEFEAVNLQPVKTEESEVDNSSEQ